jgi:hypothetical protein
MFLEAVSHKPAPPTLPDFTLKHFIKPELEKKPIKARTPQVQLVTRKTVFCRKKRRQKKSLFRGTRELEEARFRGKSCLFVAYRDLLFFPSRMEVARGSQVREQHPVQI